MADLKYKNGSNWVSIVDLFYPVGSIVMRYTNTSPANSIGGTWTTITGRFPYFNSGNGTGGSNTHTLTTAQMPSHTHALQKKDLSTAYRMWSFFSGDTPNIGSGNGWSGVLRYLYDIASDATGGGRVPQQYACIPDSLGFPSYCLEVI